MIGPGGIFRTKALTTDMTARVPNFVAALRGRTGHSSTAPGISAVTLKRRTIHALKIALDQPYNIRDIQKPSGGRLDGTHTSLFDQLPQTRAPSSPR